MELKKISTYLLAVFSIVSVYSGNSFSAEPLKTKEKVKTDKKKETKPAVKTPEKKKTSDIKETKPQENKPSESKENKQNDKAIEKTNDTDKSETKENKKDLTKEKNTTKESSRKSLYFDLSFREAFTLKSPSDTSYSFKNYTPGVSIGLDYFFNPNLNIHTDFNMFIGNGFNSFLLPVTFRYNLPLGEKFDLYAGVGGFLSYSSGKLPIGAIGELGGRIRFNESFFAIIGADFGVTFTPVESHTLGVKAGLGYSL